MKRVPRLQGEPAGIAAFRRDQGQALRASSPSNVWETFKADNAAYRELQALLVRRQQGLCGYCEQRVVGEDGVLVPQDYQVEHVTPKSSQVDDPLDATNLMLCCAGGQWPGHADPSRASGGGGNHSCGQAKGATPLPGGCDPRTFPVHSLVRVDAEGVLHADDVGCEIVGVEPSALNRAINVILRLNCERLRVARKKARADISFHLEWAQHYLTESHLDETQRKLFETALVEGRLAPDARGFLRAFWSTELLTLNGPGRAWLLGNLTRLNFDGLPPAGTRA